jgi:hypothetical protein
MGYGSCTMNAPHITNVLAVLHSVPATLRGDVLACVTDAAKFAQIQTICAGSAAAPNVALSLSTSLEPSVAPAPALAVPRTPAPPSAEPRRIYVTAPKHVQESHRHLVDGSIRALQQIWPKAEIIDANAHWPEGERRGEAWERGIADLVRGVDLAVVVTSPEGWIGMGIEREIQTAKAAGRHVLIARSPADGVFVFQDQFEIKKFKGPGSKAHIPKEIRGSVMSEVVCAVHVFHVAYVPQPIKAKS